MIDHSNWLEYPNSMKKALIISLKLKKENCKPVSVSLRVYILYFIMSRIIFSSSIFWPFICAFISIFMSIIFFFSFIISICFSRRDIFISSFAAATFFLSSGERCSIISFMNIFSIHAFFPYPCIWLCPEPCMCSPLIPCSISTTSFLVLIFHKIQILFSWIYFMDPYFVILKYDHHLLNFH